MGGASAARLSAFLLRLDGFDGQPGQIPYKPFKGCSKCAPVTNPSPLTAWDPADRAALRCAGSPGLVGLPVVGGDAGGPEVGAESGFESGDGAEVGPGGSVEDIRDGRVVDARGLFGVTQAHPGEGGAEVEGESSGGLDVRFGGGSVGPTGDQFGGRGADGAGHGSTVGRVRLRAVEAGVGGITPVVGAFSNTVGVNQQSVVDKVALTIKSYTPDLPGEHWAQIAPFVRQAVSACEQKTPYSARELLVASARHIHWCWQTAGLPLELDVVFRREVIAEYIAHGCSHMSRASAGNRRSQLLRMSELLLGPAHQVTRLAPLPPPDPTSPYSPAETVMLRSWADGQKTTYRRVNCHVLLGLGMGAGLSASEVIDVQARHVHIDDDGVLIEVSGIRARVVPVLTEWEPVLAQIASAAIRPDLYLFRPTREKTHKNLIGNFVDKTSPGRVRANTQRMRSTWIVTQLTAGTPPKVLVEAAGVDSLEALTRFLRFVPDVDPAQARRALRDAYRHEDPLP